MNGYARQTTDAEKQTAALKIQEVDKKYGIKTRERYEEEGVRLAQMIQEMERNYQIEVAMTKLGTTAMLTQLKAANDECRRLVDLRNQERSYVEKGQMQTARAEMDIQYPLTIRLINALALVDESEYRYEELIRLLNEDIRYYKTVVLQMSEKADEEDVSQEDKNEKSEVTTITSENMTEGE